MLRDWLAAAFLCSVSPRTSPCLSVVDLWFALPAIGSALVLSAVGYALLPAVGCALLGSFHHFSPSRRWALLSERIVASMFFSFIFFSPLARLLWFCLGFSTLARWLWFLLYFSLTTGFLAVALSLILPETLCGRLHLPGCLACTSNTTSQHCALRDRWLARGARAPRSCSLQQCVLLTVRTGLRSRCRCGPSVVSNTTPTPLCDSLGCVHPHYDGSHRGLLPRRGPSVRPAPLACHRSSCLSRLVSFAGLVILTRYFPSRVLMTFSLFLVIVTCSAMSFALRSAAIARLILDASLLQGTRAAVPTLLNFAVPSFCWMRFPLYLLLCTVLLNAAVFVDLALYLAVGGLCLGLVELTCSVSLSCFKHVWHRFFGCLSLEPFHALFLLLKLAGSRSATLNLATARLCARRLHHCIRRLSCGLLEDGLRYVLDLGYLCLPLHLWSHCSFLRDLDLSLKLFVITSTRSFEGVRISPGTVFSCRTRDANFGLFSH